MLLTPAHIVGFVGSVSRFVFLKKTQQLESENFDVPSSKELEQRKEYSNTHPVQALNNARHKLITPQMKAINQHLFFFVLPREMYFRLENRTQRLFLCNLITQA